MALAVKPGDTHVLHRKARKRAVLDHLQNAFFDGWHELARNRATLDGIDEFVARAARRRLDAQHHFAELSCAARLLLVPMMPFGLAANGLAVRDLRRPRD